MNETKNERNDVYKEPKEETEIIGIRFKSAGKIYYFSPAGIKFDQSEKAIVETVRGVEYGTVAIENRFIPVDELVSPLKPVIRKATPEDDLQHQKNKQLEESAREVWEEKVKKNGLVMQLVDVEYTFDNAKLIFYFTADGRVDFRELVKDLASVFKTRIELRQIGVRDEAKLFGGLGSAADPSAARPFSPISCRFPSKWQRSRTFRCRPQKSPAPAAGLCAAYAMSMRFMKKSTLISRRWTASSKRRQAGVLWLKAILTGIIKVKMNGEQGLIKNFTKNDLKVVGVIKVKDEDYEELKKLEE
jgi:hypothetical protein